jgi:hypothetical protein
VVTVVADVPGAPSAARAAASAARRFVGGLPRGRLTTTASADAGSSAFAEAARRPLAAFAPPLFRAVAPRGLPLAIAARSASRSMS